MSKRLLSISIIVAFVFFAQLSTFSLNAQTPPPQQNDPQEMLEQGMKTILNALELLLKSIPQYEAPEVLENGDIIIRRIPKNENVPKESPKPNGDTQTET